MCVAFTLTNLMWAHMQVESIEYFFFVASWNPIEQQGLWNETNYVI